MQLKVYYRQWIWGHHDRDPDRMVVGFTKLPMQSVLITNNVVSLNLAHCEVYSIQHYVLKFDSDLRQVVVFSGFLHH